jgi:hypothetical protein
MQHTLAHDDWQTLKFSPFWVRSALAGRYRDFHPLDDAAFWRCLDEAASGAAGLAREVLRSVLADRDRMVIDFEVDERPVGSGLRAVVSVLAGLSAAESAQFADVLFARVATGLARARGPFGSTISSADAETLTIICELLDLETDAVNPLSVPMPI